MKLSCEVIKDLLPLYYDEVCSTESKKMVDEHLLDCADCQRELERMGDTLSLVEQQENLEHAADVKSLSKKWRHGMLKSVLKGIALTIGSILVLALLLSIFIDFRIVL